MTERRSQLLAKWLASAGHAGMKHTASGSIDWANPLPAIIEEAYSEVYDNLCGPVPSTGAPALERLMRLRALDGPEVTQPLAFLSTLKALLHEELAPLGGSSVALADLDTRIEVFVAEAARHFHSSRQLLGELRRRESVLRTAKLTERLQRRPAAERTGP